MDKLIITCCTNDFPEPGAVHMPLSAQGIADSAKGAWNAGAAIVHVHEPFVRDSKTPMGFNVEGWLELISLIRQDTDILIEHGIAGLPYIILNTRIPEIPVEMHHKSFDLKAESPDMISLAASAVDHEFGPPGGIYMMPTRQDLEKYMILCNECNVKPAFEVWHVGAYCNLKWLIDKKLLNPPYWLTQFFGGLGSVGSPATIQELLHRINTLPEGALYQVSVFCGSKGSANTKQQLALITHAIALGGHVRIGMEDNPYYWDGVPADSNAQLVERVVRIARELGRDIASPKEARMMLGL